MNLLKKSIASLLILISLLACTDDNIEDTNFTQYLDGFFIVNEGPFNNGTGTLSFVKSNREVIHNIYQKRNNEYLGNIVQSMYLYNDYAYIVVNNSHKIIVADRYSMKKITVIEGENINNPRYFVAIGNTGYVSNWGDPNNATDDFIAVINLNTNTVSTTIPVNEGPENMLIDNENIYINLQGGFNHNNKVEILNTTSNTITSSITVGDVPNSILKDNNGMVWILCSGKPSWSGSETSGKLIKIEGNTISVSLDFEMGKHPEHLTLNTDDLYYNLDGKVYKMAVSSSTLNTNSINGFDGFYYGMKAHNNFLYTMDAGNFSSEGVIKIFDLNTSSFVYSKTTGIIPSAIVFQ